MARELTEMVKKMPKLDWTQRESVRASLRRNVRRAAGKVRLPSGSSRRRDAARLATDGIVNGELGVNQDGLAPPLLFGCPFHKLELHEIGELPATRMRTGLEFVCVFGHDGV